MGYACPVCGDPQADDEHLANHLAFTAMLGDDDHEEWLDERVPGWGSLGPDELAPRVTDHAEETEYPQVFEDTTGSDHEHDHDHGHGPSRRGGRGSDRSALGGHSVGDADSYDTDADPDDVIAEAMEMTRRMREDTEGGDGGADSGDGSESDGTAGE